MMRCTALKRQVAALGRPEAEESVGLLVGQLSWCGGACPV